MKNTIDKDLSRKENILKVTLDIIKEEGFEGVTIRKIASRANVNVALIHYHFGSKENLINESLNILTSSFKASFEILDKDDLTPRDKLKTFLIAYIGNAMRYPDIMRRIILSGSFNFQTQIEFLQFLRSTGFRKIRNAIHEITNENDPVTLNTMMLQMMGGFLFPLIIYPTIEHIVGLEAHPIDSIEKFIDTMLDNYFNKYL